MPRIAKPTLVALALVLGACSSSGKEPTEPQTPTGRFVTLPFEPDTIRERQVANGVVHTYLWSSDGPWAVHLVEAEAGPCAPEVRTRKAGNAIVGVARTSAMASAAAQELGRPVLAAVNGDFFMGDPYGAPRGAQVIQGKPVNDPDPSRPVFGITTQGTRFIGSISLVGELRTKGGQQGVITHANASPDESSGLTLYNSYVGSRTPTDAGVVEVRVSPVAGSYPVNEGRGVVVGIDTLAAGVSIPSGGVVFAGRSLGAQFLRQNVSVGDTLSWKISFSGAPGPVLEMIGGYPRLVQNGSTVRSTGSLVTERHPRTALGWRQDGTLLLVTVDGRQPGHSIGMTGAELADLMKSLGATYAINLDGGGSTTMVVQGQVVNRYSDPSERTVGNALLLVASGAPGC